MSTIASTKLAKVRILLVDDAPANIDFVQLALSQATEILFDVRCAGDLAGACSYLSLETFDLMLLNLSLPDCSTPEAWQPLRQINRSLPIVVLPAVPNDSMASKGVDLGGQGFLIAAKVSAKNLLHSIQFAIQRQQYLAAVSQYFVELEAFGAMASTFEPVSGTMESMSLTDEILSWNVGAARIVGSHREPNQSADSALRDVKEQLRIVVNAFLRLDLHCRSQLGAEGIQICCGPPMVPSECNSQPMPC